MDAGGNLFVADSGNRRIQRRDSSGAWSVLATSGSDLGQVDYPEGVAVDADGNLFVADSGNDRIQVYRTGSKIPPAVQPNDKGDLNGDGRVTLQDAILILQFAVAIGIPTDLQRAAADMNSDGRLNILDATLVLRKVVGL